MGSYYFILYFENNEQNREQICDQISLDLPERFKKSKFIFEYIYKKHGFHECILTLEYLQNKIYKEYKDDIIDKKQLFRESKRAYIKIRNEGKCICYKKNENEENLNETNKEEEEKKKFEYEQKIKEMENELENEKRKRKELELENRLKELENELEKEKRKRKELELEKKLNKEEGINTQTGYHNQLELKLKLMEIEMDKLKNEKSLNEDKFNNQFDHLNEDNENNVCFKKDNACPPLAYSNSYIKTNCFLIEYKKEYEAPIKKYETEEIYPNIKALITNTYSNFLKDLRYEDFQNNIFNILDFESMYISIKKKLEENLINICKNITKTKHFNIVILGREGVGKSTLLNSVLKLEGKDMAKTGVGDSVSLEIKRYSNSDPKMNFLRLYDTQGIGIKEENSAEKILSNIFKLIKEQLFKEDSNPDDLIHCLWFCFNGRFGDKEMEIIKKLSETYSDKTLPFIIVHTKTFSKSQAKQEIKDLIKRHKIPKEKICQVLARDEDEDEDEEKEDEDEGEDQDQDKSKKKSFGIGELMKKTVIKIEDAVESANYQFTKYHILIEIDKFLDSICKAIEIYNNKDNYQDLSFSESKEELSKVLFNNAKLLIENISSKEFDKTIALKSQIALFLNDTITKAESLLNFMIDEIGKKHSPQIGRILFEKEKTIQKEKENDFIKNERFFMYEYQDDLKNTKYPLRKNIEKEVKNYIFNELVTRVMEYFKIAIKQSFTVYARERDKEIMDLYKKFSEESIKSASKEIVEKIELAFPSKKKKK